MTNDNGYMVYPDGSVYYDLEAAKEVAKMDSWRGPVFKTRVESVDTNETLAVYLHGEEIEPGAVYIREEEVEP
jgi:hypothetical protein